jgi:hypothetical protein
MQGKTEERWQQLCEHAANEQDPAKLLALVREINDLFAQAQKQARLQNQQAETQDSNEAFNK